MGTSGPGSQLFHRGRSWGMFLPNHVHRQPRMPSAAKPTVRGESRCLGGAPTMGSRRSLDKAMFNLEPLCVGANHRIGSRVVCHNCRMWNWLLRLDAEGSLVDDAAWGDDDVVARGTMSGRPRSSSRIRSRTHCVSPGGLPTAVGSGPPHLAAVREVDPLRALRKARHG